MAKMVAPMVGVVFFEAKDVMTESMWGTISAKNLKQNLGTYSKISIELKTNGGLTNLTSNLITVEGLGSVSIDGNINKTLPTTREAGNDILAIVYSATNNSFSFELHSGRSNNVNVSHSNHNGTEYSFDKMYKYLFEGIVPGN